MQERRTRPAIEIPEANTERVRYLPPMVHLGGRHDDGRDPAKPVAYDAKGRPLYAPYRGPVARIL